MSKLAKIIRMINLLSGSQSVPLDRICQVCEISPRTAYRYLNTMSEATIPVFYDASNGGYRLVHSQYMKLDALTLADSILLTCGLVLMCRHVNDRYRKDLVTLLEKLQSSHEALVGEVLVNVIRQTESPASAPDYSRLLTSLIIELAIANRWSVKIEQALEEDAQVCAYKYERPRLRFSQGWVIADESGQDTPELSLEAITRATIA